MLKCLTSFAHKKATVWWPFFKQPKLAWFSGYGRLAREYDHDQVLLGWHHERLLSTHQS